MKNIDSFSFLSKKVLIRVDFNVPLDDNLNISDDSRIKAALPTIKKVIDDGGRAIIISHMGRPKNGYEKKFSLKVVAKKLSVLLNKPIHFSGDCIGFSASSDISKMKNGDVLVLENLRFYSEEESGNVAFAKKLSEYADFYINDAFGTAHREHASTAIIAQFFRKKKCFGILLEKEINNLNKALQNPKRPFTAIIGGSKISGKIDVINALFEKVDVLIIGGGMAYTFAKAMGGYVGDSLVENDKLILAKKLIVTAKEKNVKLLLPCDSVNGNSFSENSNIKNTTISNIPQGWMGLDIGSKSINQFSKCILNSKTIIWNGPMGVFEIDLFSEGTKKIGECVCKATTNGAYSLVGGGDSVASLKKFGLSRNVSYISTGGGAMLEYLKGNKLPAVIAILD